MMLERKSEVSSFMSLLLSPFSTLFFLSDDPEYRPLLHFEWSWVEKGAVWRPGFSRCLFLSTLYRFFSTPLLRPRYFSFYFERF